MFWVYLSMTGMIVMAIFLVLLILVQRGKGGGLAGAFGGLGGSSALGTKAGDMFTKITVGATAAWIFTCILTIWALNAVQPTGDVDIEGGVQTPAATSTAPESDQDQPASE